MKWKARCTSCGWEEQFSVIGGVGLELQKHGLEETVRAGHYAMDTGCDEVRIELTLDETETTPANVP